MEQGERARQGDFDGVAQFPGFLRFLEQPIDPALEARVRIPLRDQVVVVGVEPLGHLHGGMAGVAARQREILRQRERAGIEAETAGNAPQMREGLQHRVVPGEIADRDEVQPRVALALPVPLAQPAADARQFALRDLAPPVRLQGELELPLRADPRKPQYVSGGHASLLLTRGKSSLMLSYESNESLYGYREHHS